MAGIDWQLSTIAILFLTGLGWGLLYDSIHVNQAYQETDTFL